ncbi:MAG: thiaminase II [Candidatus Latescibacterota bacterium]|nr:MAG: thiaminase II [Candidatus Latescibacterota bacterium]
MDAKLLSHRFREDTAALWSAILDHPFVRGIGAGDLPRDKYEFYLKQDYIYLIEFSRVLALASAKAARLADMAYFGGLLQATLNTEMELHRRTCADFGISKAELAAVEPAAVTTAYTNLLVRTGYEGNFTDLLAVVLPCELGYAEIASYLASQGLPPDPHYVDWINTYSSREFIEFAQRVGETFDELAAGAPSRDIDRWFGLYLASARYELLFFEMAWRSELWPPIVPT